MAKFAKELMAQYGIKLLWGTANLFSHPRYANGAATNPDAHVFAYAVAQVKKAMEITHNLGGENFLFWGGREGYSTLLNTDVKRELDHLAQFYRLAVEYKKSLKFSGNLLIEPKPKEPTKHQYEYDAQTTIGFLKAYNLEQHFKLNIEPNHSQLAGHSNDHDIELAAKMKMLGSIDANTGDSTVGWDTDQFPMDVKDATKIMRLVINYGLAGGLNFDCKLRRESITIEDLFIAHIGAMDTFAKGLRVAVQMQSDPVWSNVLSVRYKSWNTSIGKKIVDNDATVEDCENFIKQFGEPKPVSGEQEKLETLLNTFIYKSN
jgi:xylose isomerase